MGKHIDSDIVIRLWNSNVEIETICEILEVDRQSLYNRARHLKNKGHKLDDRSQRSSRMPQKINQSTKNKLQLIDLLNKHQSYVAVAKVLGVTRQAVGERVIKYNIKCRRFYYFDFEEHNE